MHQRVQSSGLAAKGLILSVALRHCRSYRFVTCKPGPLKMKDKYQKNNKTCWKNTHCELSCQTLPILPGHQKYDPRKTALDCMLGIFLSYAKNTGKTTWPLVRRIIHLQTLQNFQRSNMVSHEFPLKRLLALRHLIKQVSYGFHWFPYGFPLVSLWFPMVFVQFSKARDQTE